MLVADADLIVEIEGVAQRAAGRLTIDLPASPYVDFTRALRSVNLTASMTTDLPDVVRDVQGLSTLTGDIVVGGSVDPHGDVTKSAAWLFNPDSPDSPLRHLTVNDCKITYEEGLYVPGSKTPKFLPASGECWINGYDLDHAAGTVTFHVTNLDPAWDSQPPIGAVATLPPFNAGLTNEYVYDAVIRGMYGASSWPATRDQCVLAVGFRSSLWPEVGALHSLSDQPLSLFAPGPWGSGLAQSADFGSVDVVYDVTPIASADIYAEFLVSDLHGSGFVSLVIANVTGGAEQFEILISHSGIIITFRDSTGLDPSGRHTWSTAIDDTAHIIGVHITMASGASAFTATITLDGTSHSSGSVATAAPRSAQYGYVTASLGQFDSISGAILAGLQVTTESSPASNYPFTPRAILDPSLNPLTVVPAFDAAAKGWDILTQGAASELGYIRKGRDGVIRFSNRDTLANQEVGRTIGSTSLLGLATTVPPSGAYRTIQAPYTEWDFDDDPTVIFTLQARKRIPAKSTIVWQQPVTSDVTALAAAIDGTVTLLADGHDPTDGGSYYRSSTDVHGTAAGPKLTITARLLNSAVIEISVQNKASSHAYLTTPSSNTDFDAGSKGSGLWIGGYLATAADEATVTCTYGDGVGTLAISSNPFNQDHDAMTDVGNYLLNQLFMTVRDYTDVSFIPDLRVDPGDLDRLVNTDPSGVDEYVSVWGWNYSASFPPAGQQGGTRDMSIDVRALGAPDAWLIGDGITDRGDINTDAWLYV